MSERGQYSRHYYNCSEEERISIDIEALREDLEQSNAAKDQAYAERNKCLVLIARMAQKLDLVAGIGQHQDKPGEEWDAEWRNILFINLPSGQVSWHLHDSETDMFYFLPGYAAPWDGHTTEEKYQRVLEPGL